VAFSQPVEAPTHVLIVRLCAAHYSAWRVWGFAGALSRESNRAKTRDENMLSSASWTLDDDRYISEALIGRLHRATEDSVLGLVSAFRPDDRAKLAMHCYRKSHLRQIGLTIATTCELGFLVQELGPVLGRAIFAQSRSRSRERGRAWERQPRTITLACSARGSFQPSDVDAPSACEQGLPA
jgi:hypothetical protein